MMADSNDRLGSLNMLIIGITEVEKEKGGSQLLKAQIENTALSS